MSTKTASTTSPRSSGGSVPTALERAEDAAENLSDDELRLFGAWLARYASQRLRRPVQFAFRALTDEEKAYGRTLAKELNAPVPCRRRESPFHPREASHRAGRPTHGRGAG